MTLWLASRSPRRHRLLREAGFDPVVLDGGIDDAGLVRGDVPPAAWVEALAWLKARWAGDVVSRGGGRGVILAADTLCIVNGAPFGQPRDPVDAARMLRDMRDAAHETLTGVCLLEPGSDARTLFHDRARVHVGALTDAVIAAYVASGAWRGKAGGYNLAEVAAAGWPVTCEGDPTTVMGLPMRRLVPLLRARGFPGGQGVPTGTL